MSDGHQPKTLRCRFQSKSYPIFIGHNVLACAQAYPKFGEQLAIVTNAKLQDLYLDKLLAALQHRVNIKVIEIPDGEHYKTLATYQTIIDQLVQAKFDRKATLIALGGGVIGDITGFVAATYMRGIDFIQVPTTLLAQVDASVGGKTAVNHSAGKNLIGAFYQPKAVVMDVATLTTLPEREYRSGLAEVIKYGLIRDAGFFTWLENHTGLLLTRDQDTLIETVARACQHKIDVVQNDEKEQGERALLNLGHTFGHALEAAGRYQDYSHGEAVAVGMVLAAEYSKHLGWLHQDDVSRLMRFLERLSLPTKVPANYQTADLINYMRSDKKVHNSIMRLILLKQIGQAVIFDQVEEALLYSVFDAYRA